MTEIKDLLQDEKARILDVFIAHINKSDKTIYGSVQILEKLDEIAVIEGFLICPYCKSFKEH